MEPKKVIEWVFYALMAGAASILTRSVNEMSDSVNRLNTQIAVIIERITFHDRTIQAHDDRLRELERKRQSK